VVGEAGAAAAELAALRGAVLVVVGARAEID
jgi:hypothetical protein